MNNRVSIYLEQEILAANGLQLVHLLYQFAMGEIRDARRNLKDREIEKRCRNIAKACDFVSELRNALNREAGGEIAERLEALYSYMLCRLLDANLHQQDEPLAEVLGLLSTLDEGWKEIAIEQRTPSPEELPRVAFAVADGFDAPSNVWSL